MLKEPLGINGLNIMNPTQFRWDYGCELSGLGFSGILIVLGKYFRGGRCSGVGIVGVGIFLGWEMSLVGIVLGWQMAGGKNCP